MSWISLAVSAIVAVAVVPAGVRALELAGLRRENYRGRLTSFPLGAVIVASALVALAPLAPLDAVADERLLHAELGRWITFVVGMAFLGLLDDVLGRGHDPDAPRGWRGHARAVLGGRLSTGAIKALGAVALAAFVLARRGEEGWQYVADIALLLLATNLFNLLDLRPGRTEKGLVLLAAGVCIGAWTVEPIELLGPFLGPVAVGATFTLRERAMLGDSGSNAIGALGGIWLLVALDPTGRLVALGAVAAITAYAEFRSLSATIERVPLLRRLDSLGRVG